MNYGSNLETLRERFGLNQREMADVLNIDKSLYRRYEKELQTIPVKHLNVLCNYFDVSFDFIFCLTDVMKYENYIKDIDEKVAGERIKEIRKENNLTQVKLATILNTVHPVITNYEKGKHLISTPFLYEICKRFQVSADYILGKTQEPKYLSK